MKEPMAKREKNESLTFKTIILQVWKNGMKTRVLLLDAMTLSASRNTHVHSLYFTISRK